jgi:hypothetical protein
MWSTLSLPGAVRVEMEPEAAEAVAGVCLQGFLV